MSLVLVSSLSAISPGLNSYFLGSGGTEPYTYAVLSGGAGGTIDPDTGFYTAPANADPEKPTDTIEVTDADASTAQLKILVGSALLLFCDIIQKEMGLADGRVYLWDQKIMQPTDKDLYIAVSEIQCKPFGNTNRADSSGSGLDAVQSVNMLSVLGIDVISRGPAARDRKAEVLMALQSTYSEQQQEANSFFIGKLPSAAQFVVLNEVDGAAIPYRYRLAINIQYIVTKNKAVSYFDEFGDVEVTTDP
jgi:hypothetical protein